jgi:hypothetical protein
MATARIGIRRFLCISAAWKTQILRVRDFLKEPTQTDLQFYGQLAFYCEYESFKCCYQSCHARITSGMSAGFNLSNLIQGNIKLGKCRVFFFNRRFLTPPSPSPGSESSLEDSNVTWDRRNNLYLVFLDKIFAEMQYFMA